MTVIDDYLEKLPERQRAELQRVRGIVKEVAPDAEEVISYRVPAFKVNGKVLVWFAAFKDHLSLYPTAEPIEVLQEKLEGFKLARGTIQFTSEKPIPEPLIREIVQIRLKSMP